ASSSAQQNLCRTAGPNYRNKTPESSYCRKCCGGSTQWSHKQNWQDMERPARAGTVRYQRCDEVHVFLISFMTPRRGLMIRMQTNSGCGRRFKRSPDSLVCHVQTLRQDTRLAHYGYKVGVRNPAGKHVHVNVPGDPCPG